MNGHLTVHALGRVRFRPSCRGFFLWVAGVGFELLTCSTLTSCALRHSPSSRWV